MSDSTELIGDGHIHIGSRNDDEVTMADYRERAEELLDADANRDYVQKRRDEYWSHLKMQIEADGQKRRAAKRHREQIIDAVAADLKANDDW
jgi:hypothetical protein